MTHGFIILRHVNTEVTNKYWIECYDCIRKFYVDNPILIIDDNSNYSFITEKHLVNTIIIKSEFAKGKGEILPYYYYSKNKIAEKIVFMHDSVFIQEKINFEDNVHFLWHFPNDIRENINKEQFLLSKLKNNTELLEIYNGKNWVGCFGGMTIITHDFLQMIINKYELFNLIDFINIRPDRMYFERVIAVLFYNELKITNSFFGNILEYCNYGYTFNDYKNNKISKPIIKVWTCR